MFCCRGKQCSCIDCAKRVVGRNRRTTRDDDEVRFSPLCRGVVWWALKLFYAWAFVCKNRAFFFSVKRCCTLRSGMAGAGRAANLNTERSLQSGDCTNSHSPQSEQQVWAQNDYRKAAIAQTRARHR